MMNQDAGSFSLGSLFTITEAYNEPVDSGYDPLALYQPQNVTPMVSGYDTVIPHGFNVQPALEGSMHSTMNSGPVTSERITDQTPFPANPATAFVTSDPGNPQCSGYNVNLEQMIGSVFDETSQRPSFSDMISSMRNGLDCHLKLPTNYKIRNELDKVWVDMTINVIHCLVFSSPHQMPSSYKQTLNLNEERPASVTWNQNAARKILEMSFSPLCLKSEYLSTQAALDNLEAFSLQEAVQALQEVVIFRVAELYRVDPEPDQLVKACFNVRGYKKLVSTDRVALLSHVYFDTIMLKGLFSYDSMNDGWVGRERFFSRKDLFLVDAKYHDGFIQILETFPCRWRQDFTVTVLTFLIVIFNPDITSLKFKETVRQEQYFYIYLLKRYLETVCDSHCDASDYHYRLMAKIDEVQALRGSLLNVCEKFSNGSVSSIRNTIAGLVYSVQS